MERKVKTKKKFAERFLSGVERVGNSMPDPITLFIILSLLVLVVSAICGAAGVSAVHPGTGETLTAVNLLSKDGIRRILSSAVTNFSGFAPFAMVLVAVIGSGAAEKSGFLATLMHKLVRGAPRELVTVLIIFVGVNANLVGDAGWVILPPLAALIFLGIGRHPLLGMFTAYASVSSGFCASLFLGMFEVQGAGFTTTAAQMIDPSYVAEPTMNWYFMIVSTFVMTAIGTFITEKVMAPRFEGADLSKYSLDENISNITEKQNKALRWACLSLLAVIALIVALSIGENALLVDPETGELMSSNSTFMKSIIVIIAFVLFVPGCVYGFLSGKYKNDRDFFADIVDAFRDMAPYILLCFFCSQFTNYFSWTNLGAILAINGADFLQSINFTGVPLMICMIILVAFLDIFIGSASAKYAILAPIIVPMLMILGISPAMAQTVYRIGDSIANPLSPLFSYFPLVLGFARRYEKDTGMGTIMANMIPYSFCFFLAWIVMIIIWCVFDLPLGPGAGVFYP